MDELLSQTLLNLENYRRVFDRFFSEAFTKPDGFRLQTFEMLIAVSRLYLDYLLLEQASPTFKTTQHVSYDSLPPQVSAIENDLRKRLRDRLEESSVWSSFDPENAFSGLTGLRGVRDYIDSFSLHLPEIYADTFRIEYRPEPY